jgi:hypothetical protein
MRHGRLAIAFHASQSGDVYARILWQFVFSVAFCRICTYCLYFESMVHSSNYELSASLQHRLSRLEKRMTQKYRQLSTKSPQRRTLRTIAAATSALVLSAISIGFSQTSVSAQTTSDIRAEYEFKQLRMGGGGFVTGLVINPSQPDRIFARTDVGGAYRWDAPTRTWSQMITTQSVRATPPKEPNGYRRVTAERLDNDYNVEGIAITPADSNLVLLAVGGETEDKLGRVLRSTDGGRTFSVGTQRWNMSGNNQVGGRTGAERMQLDPRNPAIGFLSTRRDGLWKTTDGGVTWTQVPTSVIPVGDKNAGVRFVEFDPTSPAVNGQTQRAYIGVGDVGIFEYNAASGSFTQIQDTAGFITDVSIGSDGLLWVSEGNRLKVWSPTTRTWTDRTPDNMSDAMVVVDPKNSQRIFVGNGGQQDGRFWRSLDGGQNWTPLNIAIAASRVPWLARSGEDNFMTSGRMVFNPNGELWFAQGAGVWTTTDLADDEVTWNENSVGIEELVPADIIAPPGGKTVSAVGDFHGFLHENIDAYPSKMFIGTSLGANTSLDYAGGNPQVIVAAGATTNLEYQGCGYGAPCNGLAGISRDGGRSWTPFTDKVRTSATGQLGDGRYQLSAGNVLVSADANSLLWVPSNNRAPAYSADGGQSWNTIGQLVGRDTNDRFVWSRRVADSDKVAPGTFYVNVRADGIWRLAISRDGGYSWADGAVLPVSQYPDYNVHGQVRSAPGKAGHVWVSGASAGLFRSSDFGATVQKVEAVQEAFNFGFGAPAPGASYPTVFAHARINDQWGIWRSTDEGASWQLIGDYPLGIYDGISVVNGDMNKLGRVYVGLGGNGFAYGEDTGAPISTVTTLPTTTLPTTTLPTTTANPTTVPPSTVPPSTAPPTTAGPTTVAATLVPTTTAAVPTCSDNLIINPGFEVDLSNWDSWDGDDKIVADARSGSGAWLVAGRGQFFTVTPGQKFDVSVWAKAGAEGWSAVGLDFFSTTDRIPNAGAEKQIRTETFTESRLSATAPTNAVRARVWAWSGNQVLTVDDWCVRAS